MLDHLEQPFCIDGVDVDFGLQAADFGRPGHRFARDAVRAELHETFVESVEVTLVLYMNTFLYYRQLLRRIELIF